MQSVREKEQQTVASNYILHPEQTQKEEKGEKVQSQIHRSVYWGILMQEYNKRPPLTHR